MSARLEKLRELGLHLPEVAKPLAAYVPAVRTGNLVYVSGQLPIADGKLLMTGKVGADVSVEQAHGLAQRAALNAIAAAAAEAGGIDRISRIVKVTGFVACVPEFTEHPKVVNGASELFGQVFGDAGAHARAAVGVPSLPLNAPVEIEIVAEIG
ncbi:RidA family protein [Sporichthya polymorpha]|uniref:RidA family protein n=1 Tax=Sporichthya polymorpha TaxID=35751 RepID=UPI000376723F|nr:RidA family protein [Sporichthya polymorpha]